MTGFDILSNMAIQGDPTSMYMLGLVYLKGIEVTPYPEEAKYWLNKVYAIKPSLLNKETLNFINIKE